MIRTAIFTFVLTLSATANAGGAVQVVHLSPDAPAVDVWANGSGPYLMAVPYLAATPTYRVSAGTYGLDFTAAGDVVPVLSADVMVENRSSYTVVAWDELSMLRPAVLQNDIDGLMPGYIRLQVTHTAVGVGTVDLWDLSSGIQLIDDFDFGGSGRLDVPAGALNLGLDLDEDGMADVTFDVPELGADVLVNVFAINDSDGVALYALYRDGTTARVDAR